MRKLILVVDRAGRANALDLLLYLPARADQRKTVPYRRVALYVCRASGALAVFDDVRLALRVLLPAHLLHTELVVRVVLAHGNTSALKVEHAECRIKKPFFKTL